MPYIGKSPVTGNYNSLDDMSGSFNSSTTTFNLLVNSGTALTPVRAEALIISINGVIQEPGADFTVSAATMTYTTAPASTDSFFGVVLGQQLDIATPGDGTVGTAKIADGAVTMAKLGETVTIAKGGTGATAAAAAFTALAASAATIGSGAEEDTKLVFDGHAQDYYIGLDDTDDDFKVGLGSAVGTTAHMVFDAAGIVTKPLQPAFYAWSSGVNTVATGAVTELTWTTERFDINADFDLGGERFTAPVAGVYLLQCTISSVWGMGTTDGGRISLYLYKNGSLYEDLGRLDCATGVDWQNLFSEHYLSGTLIENAAADDYYEMFGQNGTGATVSFNYTEGFASFQGALLG